MSLSLPLKCSKQGGREIPIVAGGGMETEKREGKYVGEGSPAISDRDSCDALLHTHSGVLWHSGDCGGWTVAGKGNTAVKECILCLDQKENPVKSGCGEQEGSVSQDFWVLSVRHTDVTLKESLCLRKGRASKFPESDTHTHAHFLSPACNCGWRRVEKGRKSNLNFLPQPDPPNYKACYVISLPPPFFLSHTHAWRTDSYR